MPETSSPDETLPPPSTVGNTFMRQYYHFLAKEPQSLHRFYKAESQWCHGLGSHMEEPIAGQRAINEQILKRGYAGARVDLDAGSIDCQNSLGGGVLVLVTGVMTLRTSPEPKPFVQTFFLAVQPKGYFVLNDCLRFLELPEAAAVEVSPEAPVEKTKTPSSPEKNGKKTETQAPTSPVKKEKPVVESPKKVESPAKTVTKTTTKKVKEIAPTSPVKAEATVASSPVKKTVKKEEKKETPAPVAAPVAAPAPAASPVKTASPVKSPVTSPVKSPKKQEAPASSPAPAPADPVVSIPAEPEKPKTWAALFSGPKTAAITPSAAPASTPTKPATPKAAASAAPVSTPTSAPATDSPAPEKSPKNKSGNGKEKEHKRFYSLFIRDVPSQTRENDLRELFKGYGSIAGVNVVNQRGFAFVDYYEQESMRAALAESKEFKVFDKVLQVDERTERGERKEGPRGGFRGNDSRGRGRGHGPKGGRGERKERNGDEAPPSNKGERREGSRREKTGNRRGGKVDATSNNRAE